MPQYIERLVAGLLCLLITSSGGRVAFPFVERKVAQRSEEGRTPALTPLTKKQAQIANFLSGGVAGTISSTLTLPLEVVKTQLQSSRLGRTTRNPIEMAKVILAQEGPLGMFKGLKPLLIGIMPTRAIYFWSYSESKALLRPRFGDTPINHLLSAFSAGITSNTIMNPWWMVKTRYQILADKSVGQVKFKNYGQVVELIWKEEGIKGFYKGMVASYVGCVEGAIQWIVYEKLKTSLQARADRNAQNAHKRTRTAGNVILSQKSGEIRPVEFFGAAAFSKTLAIIASYPHEVVRTRMREQAINGVFKYKGFFSSLSTIAREEGVRGLYSGMSIHLARSVPNAALMFLSYELIGKFIARRSAEGLKAAASGKQSKQLKSKSSKKLIRSS